MKVLEKYKFKSRVRILLFLFVVTLTVLQSAFFFSVFEESITHQVGTKALVQAKNIAADAENAELLVNKKYAEIFIKFNKLSELSDADYIVIADKNEIRRYHPNSTHIGKKINSNDNKDALENKQSYISEKVGESGLSVRGKSPVIDKDGNVVGVVAVGYLIDKLSSRIIEYAFPLIFIFGISCLLSLMGAFYFSNHIKSQMFDMEPSEIAATLQLKRSVMESMYEGIVAISKNGEILNINKRALDMLGIVQSKEQAINQLAQNLITPVNFFVPSLVGENTENNVNDELVSCNGETFIANRVPMISEGKTIGFVVSLRQRDDIGSLTTKLAQAQHYIDNLRVIRHEHNNQLSTISGLIQIGEYEKALAALESTNSEKQEVIDSITKNFRPRTVAGLLLGKYSRAKEMGLRLEFDPMSHFSGESCPIKDEELTAMLGNLLDNAFESTLKNPKSNKTINLLMSDQGEDLVIVVTDNGVGFDDYDNDNIFNRGITSKDEPGHGIGLYLVDQYVKRGNGTIIIEESEPTGAVISIYVPKIEEKKIS
ncbi:ATP-binding protein [Vibrio sp. HN007]|uniref:ATP-binding protein n=1 Tax=Vibrio iocasae TaxID=3098914 RepID=UPI0035D4D6DE